MSETPIPVVTRTKTWVYGCLLAVIAGSYTTSGMDVSLVSVMCCQKFLQWAGNVS